MPGTTHPLSFLPNFSTTLLFVVLWHTHAHTFTPRACSLMQVDSSMSQSIALKCHFPRKYRWFICMKVCMCGCIPKVHETSSHFLFGYVNCSVCVCVCAHNCAELNRWRYSAVVTPYSIASAAYRWADIFVSLEKTQSLAVNMCQKINCMLHSIITKTTEIYLLNFLIFTLTNNVWRIR